MNTSEYLQRAALVAAGPRQCGKSKILRPTTGSMEGLATNNPTNLQCYECRSCTPNKPLKSVSCKYMRIGGRYWLNVKTINPTHPNPPTAQHSKLLITVPDMSKQVSGKKWTRQKKLVQIGMSIDWTNFELQQNTFTRGQRDTSVVVFDHWHEWFRLQALVRLGKALGSGR